MVDLISFDFSLPILSAIKPQELFCKFLETRFGAHDVSRMTALWVVMFTATVTRESSGDDRGLFSIV